MTHIDIVDIRNNIDMRKQFIDLDRPVPTSLLARIADKAPALCDELDRLTADLNDALPQITAAWIALDKAGFQSPVAGIAELIDQLAADLAERDAQLAKSREQAATYANEMADRNASLARVRQERDEGLAEGRRQAAADVGHMPITLGDAGWEHLEAGAVEADYPAALVRRRRTRDDFTTCTIEAAYQYGYRQAAKVARGEVAPR